MSATTTPWKVIPIAVDEPGPGEDGTIYEYFIREGLVDVAKTFEIEVAEKIVRAINAHDKLLEIAKEAFNYIPVDNHPLEGEAQCTCNIRLALETAIAKAEGKL